MCDGRQSVGLVGAGLAEALAGFEYPEPAGHVGWAPSERAGRLVLDADAAPDGARVLERRVAPDHPVSFAPRRFLPRETVVLAATDVP